MTYARTAYPKPDILVWAGKAVRKVITHFLLRFTRTAHTVTGGPISVVVLTGAFRISIRKKEEAKSVTPACWNEDPRADAGWEHLVVSKGYPFESHKVETEDGYVIEMHRIPEGRTPSSRPGQPVFLMTGLGADSSIFVFDFPGQSLGFVLADDGYDVWLGNTRGSTYGKEHRTLDVKSKRFWDFSFHEHSLYDAPAQIDYVLNTTGSPSLIYVGYSQGTLMFFTMISERPEYNSKVYEQQQQKKCSSS
ncbi:lipase 3-like [Ixodes scapularis]|uniref:lipase 3-like n=1 Tax=Ixodes scapularis TaxID=6945 RepID=UPI001C37F03B|nr:lipase 3-like [Ixodes scapularis]